MKVVVCGGRGYRDGRQLFATLDKMHRRLGFTELMQGGAEGADKLAAEWAATYPEIRAHQVDAKWRDQGIAAGARATAIFFSKRRPI